MVNFLPHMIVRKFSTVLAAFFLALAASAQGPIVYGWYPSWSSQTAVDGLDPSLLTHLSWFDAQVDTATGALTVPPSWMTGRPAAWALEHGIALHLTVTCFGTESNTAWLSSPAKRQHTIDDIVEALRQRQGRGVCIDAEGVPGSQRENLTTFMTDLSTALRATFPAAELTMATPAVDWSNVFDLAALADICDYLCLMGYDYYWDASPTAGPVAPLGGENLNVTRSVNTYLDAGVPPSRLVLGVPLYGRRWPVSSTNRKATATGRATAVTFATAMTETLSHQTIFDEPTSTLWYNDERKGSLTQTWVDDSLSLARKYEMAKAKGLRGIALWALGYDGGRREVWGGIRTAWYPASSVAEGDGRPERLYEAGRYTVLGQEIPPGTSWNGPQIVILTDGNGRVYRRMEARF